METTISSLEVLLKPRVRFPQSFDESDEVISLTIFTSSEGMKSTEIVNSRVVVAAGNSPFTAVSAWMVMVLVVLAVTLSVLALIVIVASLIVSWARRIRVMGMLKLVCEKDIVHQLGFDVTDKVRVLGVR